MGVSSQLMSHLSKDYWKGVKREFRYIQRTLDHRLFYVSSISNNADLSAYTNACLLYTSDAADE